MEYHERQPPAPLDRWVHCYWFLRGAAGGAQPVVPDGRMEIVLHLADPFEQLEPSGGVTRQWTAVLAGQLTRPIHLRPGPRADIVGIRFRTAGARALLGLPLEMVRDRIVPLADVARPLTARLLQAARSPTPVPSLSRVLLDHLEDSPADAEARSAVRRLGQGAAVTEVARELRVSVRTLERRLGQSTGLPPKLLQSVLRFRRFYALLRDGAASGARAAALAGYFDQSHADRDFRRFAGASPTGHFGAGPTLATMFLSDSS